MQYISNFTAFRTRLRLQIIIYSLSPQKEGCSGIKIIIGDLFLSSLRQSSVQFLSLSNRQTSRTQFASRFSMCTSWAALGQSQDIRQTVQHHVYSIHGLWSTEGHCQLLCLSPITELYVNYMSLAMDSLVHPSTLILVQTYPWVSLKISEPIRISGDTPKTIFYVIYMNSCSFCKSCSTSLM